MIEVAEERFRKTKRNRRPCTDPKVLRRQARNWLWINEVLGRTKWNWTPNGALKGMTLEQIRELAK